MKINVYDKVSQYTMTSKERVIGLSEKVACVISDNIEGCLIECGVWKCGMLGVMSITNKALNGNRKIYGFDSFEGLPKSDREIDGAESFKWEGNLKISIAEAERNLITMGADDVQLCKGFFENTLSEWKTKVEKISILRLDGDWYSSTITCLNELYDLVSPGGFIIIDDYGHWQGCRKAVDEFRNMRSITTPLNQTDYTEFWWRK